MSSPRRWLSTLALALLIGVGAAIGAVVWLHETRAPASESSAPVPTDVALADLSSDRIDETLAALGEDGVSVTDDGRYLLDPAGERAVEQAVEQARAAGTAPVFVVVWAAEQSLGANESDVVDELVRRLGDAAGAERGVLYVWQGPQTGFVETVGDDGYVPDFSTSLDFVGDPAVTLPLAVAAVADVSWYGDYDDNGGSDYWGGAGGGSLLGAFIALGIVLLLRGGAFLVRLAGGPRLPGRWGWSTKPQRAARRGRDER